MPPKALEFRKSIVGLGHDGDKIRIMVGEGTEEGLKEYLDFLDFGSFLLIFGP